MNELIEKACGIIREASNIMLKRDFVVNEKTSTSDLVTSADIAVQKYLEERLVKLLPGSTFFGEEGKLGETTEYLWVNDPIDGTANFARDLGLSVISVALLKDGEPYIGIVYNPYRDEMFTALKGNGAYLNGSRIHVSDRPFIKSALCSAMSLYAKEYAKPCFNIIERVYVQSDDLRRLGTAAYELCLLAAGKVDLYFEIRLSCWDYAAGILLIKEAGGFVEMMHADRLYLDKPASIVAANTKENFEKIKGICYEEIPSPLW